MSYIIIKYKKLFFVLFALLVASCAQKLKPIKGSPNDLKIISDSKFNDLINITENYTFFGFNPMTPSKSCKNRTRETEHSIFEIYDKGLCSTYPFFKIVVEKSRYTKKILKISFSTLSFDFLTYEGVVSAISSSGIKMKLSGGEKVAHCIELDRKNEEEEIKKLVDNYYSCKSDHVISLSAGKAFLMENDNKKEFFLFEINYRNRLYHSNSVYDFFKNII